MMKEKFTSHISDLLEINSIRKQYLSNDEEQTHSAFEIDPLMEDEKEVVKGLIHKYANRALIKVSYRCAAHCRFCTRYRQIGSSSGDLTPENIEAIINYIRANPSIDDVIFSGGDPLYTPKQTIILLKEVAKIESVKVVRIGSRLAIHSPQSFSSALISDLIDEAAEINKVKPVHILLNIEHPAELTDKTIEVIRNLRAKGFTLFSQSVFLKGINDDYDVLYELFNKLYHLGVMPYYIYRCDYVRGVESFIADLEKERIIMTKLRNNLSGLACPTYIVDVAGYGKLPVPLHHWHVQDIYNCTDYMGKKIKL